MKKSLLLLCGLTMAALSANAQEFVNLDFESCTVSNNVVSVPGWRHSNGSDTGFQIGRTHIGVTQWHRLVGPFSSQGGNYAMSFVSGRFKSNSEHAPRIQAYIAQVARIPGNAAFIQLEAEGNFKILMEGVEIPMVALGNNFYEGDVRGFSGGIAELKIVNASLDSRTINIDNISFEPLVPSEVWWQHTNGSLARWEIGGSTLYSSIALPNAFGAGWKAVARADFDADESSDIVFQNDSGLVGVQLMKNNAVIDLTMPNDLPAHEWRVFDVADLDNDRAPDLFLQHRVDGRLAVRLMDGTNFLSTIVVTNGLATEGMRAIATGDFNDGQTDVLLQDASGRLVVWLGPDFNSTIALRNGLPVGSGWSVEGIADELLNDGTSGILFHHVDGRVGVWRMRGAHFVESLLLPRTVGPAWSVVGVK